MCTLLYFGKSQVLGPRFFFFLLHPAVNARPVVSLARSGGLGAETQVGRTAQVQSAEVAAPVQRPSVFGNGCFRQELQEPGFLLDSQSWAHGERQPPLAPDSESFSGGSAGSPLHVGAPPGLVLTRSALGSGVFRGLIQNSAISPSFL